MSIQMGGGSAAIASVPSPSEADVQIERRLSEAATYDSEPIWRAQDELTSAIAEAGIHFEGQACPACLRPLVIGSRLENDLITIAESMVKLLDAAAQLYCRNPEVQDLFPAYKHLLRFIVCLPKHRPIVRICRLDGLFSSDGHYKIIETNTEGPGGVIQTGLIANVWSHVANPLTHGLAFNVGKQPLVRDPHCFVRELMLAHREETGRDLRTAAIANFRGRFTNETDWIEKRLRDVGVEAVLLDLSEIRRTSRGLAAPDGQLIDLVYNKLDVRDVIDSVECNDYLEACAAQEVVTINPWICQWILSDKAILAVLTDDRYSSHFDSEQMKLIARHIPWTRLVRAGITTDIERRRIELIGYIRENKNNLVLKPSNATRGEHVLVGRLTSSEVWDEHIRYAASKPYVVQEYIWPGELTALHLSTRSIRKMVYGLDCYVFGGRVAGFNSRASFDAVMNVGRSGILLPVAVSNAAG
ncbi:hypothetical protein ACVWW6_000026 [Bradyrhizobium sp. USDA 3311]